MGAWDKIEKAAKDAAAKAPKPPKVPVPKVPVPKVPEGGVLGKIKDVADSVTGKAEADRKKAEEAAAAEAAAKQAAADKAAATKKAAAAKKAAPKKAAAKKAAPEKPRTYTVKKGDNLSTIALKHGKGISYQELAKFNKIKDPDLIHPGQVIKFPQ